MREDEKMTVKQGLDKDYEEYVSNNQDPYGNACIVAGAKIGKALDENKKPEEAEKEMHGMELTGFMAGAAAQAVSHFHPRSNDFRLWWNKSYGVKESEAKGGVVNPAIMTMK